MRKSRLSAYLALLTASIIWGIAPPVIKYTLQFVSPISFLFYRFVIVSLIMAIPCIIRSKKISNLKEHFSLYLTLGLLCTPINLLLLFMGIEKTTAIDASLISIISPILVVLGGAYFLKEIINKNQKIGISLTVAGTFLTLVQPLLEKKSVTESSFQGNFLVLLGTLVWVYFTILTKKFHKEKIDPFLLTGISFFLGFLVLLPLYLFENFPDYSLVFKLDQKAVLGILFMAVFSSAIAYFAYIYGLTKIEASRASIFTYLQPIFAVPIATFFLHEKITLPFITGAAFIILGVLLCEHNPGKNSVSSKAIE